MNVRTLLPGTTLITLLACGHSEAPKAPELPTASVRILPPQGATEGGWVAASLQRTDQATLSTRLAGTVKRVWVSEGARVAQGQLLLELEATDLLGQLSAAQSGRDAAAAHHRRIKALQAQGAATPSEAEGAAASLAQAEAGVAAIQGQLAYAQIRAPFAGTVQRRDIQAGAFAGPGQPLLTLEGSGSLELTASLSEAEAAGLKTGQKVTFEADGRKGQAQLIGLAVGGDPLTHRQALRARVLAPTDLRSGAFARLQVAGASGSKDVRVPDSALVKRGELSGVFVAEQGRAHLRWLNIGETQGASVEVRAGLKTTDRVIAEPGDLKDGQPIAEASEPVPEPPHAALGAPGGTQQGRREERSGSTRFEHDVAGCRPPPQPEGTMPGGRSAASGPLPHEPHGPAGPSLQSIPPGVVAAHGGSGTGSHHAK